MRSARIDKSKIVKCSSPEVDPVVEFFMRHDGLGEDSASASARLLRKCLEQFGYKIVKVEQ